MKRGNKQLFGLFPLETNMTQQKLSFSQRYGYTQVDNTIQVESLNTYLRNDIWNYLYNLWFKRLCDGHAPHLLVDIHTTFLHQRIDELPYFRSGQLKIFEDIILKGPWSRVYDFLEFCYNFLTKESFITTSASFSYEINAILTKNNAGYRMVKGEITPITNKSEIKTIQLAIDDSPYKEIGIHLTSALKFFSDKTTPDYRNSIKESISAVEVLCRKITGESTLDRALKKLQAKGIVIPDMLRESIEKLYYFTNGKEGIRHALMDDPKVGQSEAYFMLIACSSFINYLKSKQSVSK